MFYITKDRFFKLKCTPTVKVLVVMGEVMMVGDNVLQNRRRLYSADNSGSLTSTGSHDCARRLHRRTDSISGGGTNISSIGSERKIGRHYWRRMARSFCCR